MQQPIKGSKKNSMPKICVSSYKFKMDNQQGPSIWHMELCLMLCGSLDGRGVWGRMDTRVCMTRALCCLPETIRALLVGYSPILNGFPGGASGKELACQCRRHKRRGFDSVGKIPCRRVWQPTLVFLSGDSHGQRSLVCYSP